MVDLPCHTVQVTVPQIDGDEQVRTHCYINLCVLTVCARVGPLSATPDHRAITDGRGVKGVWVPAAPHLITGEVKDWAALSDLESIPIPGYWLEKRGTDLPASAPAAPGEKVLYALHGGGYVVLSAHPSSPVSVVPHGILKHTGPTLVRCFNLEYRLTKHPSTKPSNPFPAALVDAIAGYNYLVREVGFAPENIIIEGDSAGGNLALALTRYLVENQGRQDVPMPPPPGGLILLSPWVDLGPADDPASSLYTCQASDFINMANARSRNTNGWIFGPLGTSAGSSNRYISPASLSPSLEPISFKGFPRTICIYGGAEILRDQIRVLNKRIEADLGPLMTSVEMPDCMHDHTGFTWFEPERTEACAMMGKWVDSE